MRRMWKRTKTLKKETKKVCLEKINQKKILILKKLFKLNNNKKKRGLQDETNVENKRRTKNGNKKKLTWKKNYKKQNLIMRN